MIHRRAGGLKRSEKRKLTITKIAAEHKRVRRETRGREVAAWKPEVGR
jgi:hypothetical protein